MWWRTFERGKRHGFVKEDGVGKHDVYNSAVISSHESFAPFQCTRALEYRQPHFTENQFLMQSNRRLKEVTPVSEKEKQIIQSLKKSVNMLPDDKREFLRGYAEGVAAMAEKKSDKANDEE